MMRKIWLLLIVCLSLLLLSGCSSAIIEEKETKLTDLQKQLTAAVTELEILQKSYNEEISGKITSISPYTNSAEELGFIVTTSSCYTFPYVEYPFLNRSDNFMKGHLFHVDKRYLIETADGGSEYWLLLSHFDNKQLGQYYLEMGLNQVWIKQSDAVPYTKDLQKELVFPVWVAEGTKDIEGSLVRTEMNPYSILKTENDIMQISAHGGTSHWIAFGDVIFPDVETYGESHLD